MTADAQKSEAGGAGEPFRVHFGGPDRPAGLLRDLLQQRIEAVPAGGEILWITYYFLDGELAHALTEARRRGVTVTLVLEDQPRTRSANTRLRTILEGDGGLGQGLRYLRHFFPDNLHFRRGRMHEKLYYFSHPVPHALVGSFNPSGNEEIHPEILKEIGNQDRGHNALVEIRDPDLAAGLRNHGLRLHRIRHGPWERFQPISNRPVATVSGTRILALPRLGVTPLFDFFDRPGSDHLLRIAMSHFNHRGICNRLLSLADTGVRIEILAHDTLRRVPRRVASRLERHPGIAFRRYRHPEGLPMHNKFILSETPDHRTVAFGSLNFSRRSLHANHELLVISEDLTLFRDFADRWDQMWQETEGQTPCDSASPNNMDPT